MANAIVEALEHAAQRVGKTLSRDAGKAVEKMYRDAGVGMRRVVANVERADKEHAGRLVELAENMGKLDSRQRLSPGAAARLEANQNHMRRLVDPSEAKPYDYEVTLDRGRYPESAQHIEEAQQGEIWRGDSSYQGQPKPSILTVDRDGAGQNREDSLSGVPTASEVDQTRGTSDYPDHDRDEYPPAMFAEGGSGASVKYISASDNSGAGASFGNKLRGLPEFTKVKISVR